MGDRRENASVIVGCMRLAGKTGEEMDRFVRFAFDHGLNGFDYADIYGSGRSEELYYDADMLAAAMALLEGFYLSV